MRPLKGGREECDAMQCDARINKEGEREISADDKSTQIAINGTETMMKETYLINVLNGRHLPE